MAKRIDKDECAIHSSPTVTAPTPGGAGHVFVTLDGLRGVAALVVAIYHAHRSIAPIHPGAAFLAVDLFFCLSGFVIAHAYGRKLDAGMSFRQFAWLRLLRLYPLYALALAIQAFIFAVSALVGSGSFETATLAILPAIFFLPNPWDHKLYPVNEPAWSLFFELAVNFLAALFWRRLTIVVLVALTAAGALGMTVLALRAGTLDGGATWDSFALGAMRVTFSFFAGMLIYYWRGRVHLPRIPWPALALLLLAAMFAGARLGVVGELALVLFLFPLLVALGSVVEPRDGRLPLLTGRLSYAFYVLHIPLFDVVANILARSPLTLAAPWRGIVMISVLLVVSWAADVWFDQPVRRLLGARWGSRRKVPA